MTALPSEPFGRLPDGRETSLYTLENDQLRVRITDFGGRMVSIEAPDRNGRRDHVLLGFDNVDGYRTAGSFGTLLGRYANRIATGSFTLDGQTYTLSRNDGDNTLHGGADGFSKRLWGVITAAVDPLPTLALTLVSPDGDQGFPGEVTVRATFRTQRGHLVAKVRGADDQADDHEPERASLFQPWRSRFQGRAGPRGHHRRRGVPADRCQANSDR